MATLANAGRSDVDSLQQFFDSLEQSPESALILVITVMVVIFGLFMLIPTNRD